MEAKRANVSSAGNEDYELCSCTANQTAGKRGVSSKHVDTVLLLHSHNNLALEKGHRLSGEVLTL